MELVVERIYDSLGKHWHEVQYLFGKMSFQRSDSVFLTEVGNREVATTSTKSKSNDRISKFSQHSFQTAALVRFKGNLSYLIEDTTVSHYSALGVHMLVGPFPFDRDNPLHLSRDDNLPDQLGRQVLSAQKHPDWLFHSSVIQVSFHGRSLWGQEQ